MFGAVLVHCAALLGVKVEAETRHPAQGSLAIGCHLPELRIGNDGPQALPICFCHHNVIGAAETATRKAGETRFARQRRAVVCCSQGAGGGEVCESAVCHLMLTGCAYFIPVVAMPVVMFFCKRANMMVIGSNVSTVMARMRCHCTFN